MQITNVTFRGPPIDDEAVLDQLPENLRLLLKSVNGFIQHRGGLHVRGACLEPQWHSLRSALEGDSALHALYPSVQRSDVPFAQDCVGDQFLLRGGSVYRLSAETGEIDLLAPSLTDFFASAAADPVKFLGLQPLMQLEQDGGKLEPGELIHAYPPFCTEEAASGVSLKAVPASQVMTFHAKLAAMLPGDGQKLEIKWIDG